MNNGKTPASNVRVLSLVDFKGSIPPDFDFMIFPRRGYRPADIAAIGPGKDKFHSSILPRQLSRTELRELTRGLKWFHVWGQVTYEDVFKIERHTVL